MTEHAPQPEAPIIEKRLSPKVGREPRVQAEAFRILEQIGEPVRQAPVERAMLPGEGDDDDGDSDDEQKKFEDINFSTAAIETLIWYVPVAIVGGALALMFAGPALVTATATALGISTFGVFGLAWALTPSAIYLSYKLVSSPFNWAGNKIDKKLGIGKYKKRRKPKNK
ncbi:MAG: hypothetical protein AAB573_05515 [Patescibacteria group bacterium]